jgi:hypothetical protein
LAKADALCNKLQGILAKANEVDECWTREDSMLENAEAQRRLK